MKSLMSRFALQSFKKKIISVIRLEAPWKQGYLVIVLFSVPGV